MSRVKGIKWGELKGTGEDKGGSVAERESKECKSNERNVFLWGGRDWTLLYKSGLISL